ncbi:MAG: hypothetical protein K0S33_2934 [Bacteroidetes bacterium]|jgi:hypothetical protein|nr:hypothetical protein [Bacteroidota bacterium]
MINKKLLIALLAFLSVGMYAQVGFNCQFVPGLQVGSVKVKTDNTRLKDYKFGAALPIFMIDRIKTKWYTNLEMNALYYATTQVNNVNAGKVKIAKTEGAYIAGRLGYGFGKGDAMRVGPNINLGWGASNLDSSKRTLNVPSYYTIGGGVFFYQKIGSRIRAMAKVGYEKYKNKSANDNVKGLSGSGIYMEGTVAYNVYQKFGLAVMPAFYSKKFSYNYGGEAVSTNAKVRSLFLRIGFVKFF